MSPEPLPPPDPPPLESGWIVTTRRSLRRRVAWCEPFLVIIITLLVVAGLALLLWTYTLYRLRVEVSLIHLTIDAHLKERAIKDEAWRAEFDRIYGTLYEPPTATVERKPSAVEVWQINRDKELRARIQRLEEWRLQMQSR